MSRAGFNRGAWQIAKKKKNKYPALLQKCSVYRLGEISASNNFEMRHFVAGAVFAIKDCRAHSLLSGRELGEKSRATKPLEQFDILYNLFRDILATSTKEPFRQNFKHGIAQKGLSSSVSDEINF